LPAIALAAAAAADKGLSLSPEALEAYARAIEGRLEDRADGADVPRDDEPDKGGRRVDSDGHERGRQDAEDGGASRDGTSDGHDTSRGGTNGDCDRGGPVVRSPAGAKKTEELSPKNLQQKLESIEANSPLTAILNSLPGRNGQRWIVIPFKMETDTVEYRVSLRILLYGEEAFRCKAERLVLDVEGWAKNGTAGESIGGRLSRWLFTLKGGGEPESCLDVRRDPPAADPEGLKSELGQILGEYAGRIQVGTLVPGTLDPESGGAEDQGEYDFFPKIDNEVYY
jgi:hypothetical protein